MITIEDSKDINIGGKRFDFSGHIAELTCNGLIIKVVRMSDGKDVTNEFKVKYNENT